MFFLNQNLLYFSNVIIIKAKITILQTYVIYPILSILFSSCLCLVLLLFKYIFWFSNLLN